MKILFTIKYQEIVYLFGEETLSVLSLREEKSDERNREGVEGHSKEHPYYCKRPFNVVLTHNISISYSSKYHEAVIYSCYVNLGNRLIFQIL